MVPALRWAPVAPCPHLVPSGLRITKDGVSLPVLLGLGTSKPLVARFLNE